MKEYNVCSLKRVAVLLRENCPEELEGGFGDWIYSAEVEYQNWFALDQDDWGFSPTDRVNPSYVKEVAP